MPYEVLQRSDVRECRTVEFLASEKNVILHSLCHRVLGVHALADYGGVVAVDVIDRDVREHSHCPVDDTLVRVCELEVIVGVGEGEVESYLNPFLDLGVDVGTETETVELGTDEGTLLIHIVS